MNNCHQQQSTVTSRAYLQQTAEKTHFKPSSGLHTTMKLSEYPSKPDRITAGTMPILRRNLISYQPNQSGYRMQFPKDGTQAWSKPRQRHPTPTSSKHHKMTTGETTHILKKQQYQLQLQSQKIQPTILMFHYSQYKGMCILSTSALPRNPPSSNEGNSSIATQCAPTLQSIPTVEKVKIKEPRRSSRISKLPEH